MNKFVLLTDSSCDLPADLAESMELVVLPLTVFIDDDAYHNYLDGREIGFHEFYTRCVTAKTLKTSAVNFEQFTSALEPILQAGNDVLYIGFSSGLSSAFSSGAMAMLDLRERYPERKLLSVDSLCASLGQGLLLELCWKEKQKGATIEEVRSFAENMKLHICHWFTVDNLNHLKKGGRISATTAIVGSVLNIKPVMHMDNEGHLVGVTIARGRKAALKALVKQMEKLGDGLEKQHLFISHGDCLEDAEYLAGLIREQTGITNITINYVGPVIGAHTGPGVISLFFIGTER